MLLDIKFYKQSYSSIIFATDIADKFTIDDLTIKQ